MGNSNVYRRTSSMEPLMPTSLRRELAKLSAQIFTKAGELKTTLPSESARAGIGELVRQMNSYYSNLIEGHKTLPRDIERAMQSTEPSKERDQRMSVAHVRVEKEIRDWLAQDPTLNVYTSDFISEIHRRFYRYLPEEDHQVTSATGKSYPLEPGEFRTYQVDVGKHTPPDHAALPAYMKRFEYYYTYSDIPETDKLIALAAAHHRLVWIHPFGDGNGRVTRLQSQAAMIRLGVDGGGLWTLSRGLARKRDEFQKFLERADRGRLNDYDGRGNLSDQHLAEFCQFFLSSILDQMDFMLRLIKPSELRERIGVYVAIQLIHLDQRMRERLTRLLCELCCRDELPRGEVANLLGVKDTTARIVIRTAIEHGLITSESEKGSLHLHFPVKVAEIYFPTLLTDLAPG